ncbi:pyrroline-5-carboxylate reductase [Niallia sp. FSL W8-0635]|uniref:pyrroline-5-carboxylate reductase n=1 Tax=Niallia sp. FSL W8-0635 TaxID=2975337 RepID=UPI0009CE0DFD|nr:pyrroline-5-carboxylate reductase ProC [Mycobacteroides abscessus subsp. abscessus]HEO8421722.1 pyrroline-5-carboxylate reductase [Yersinia enterocolitica]
MLKGKTVAFIGAGSMAEAMIAGAIQAEKLPSNQIIVTNNSNNDRLQELANKYEVRTLQKELLPYKEIDLFILAMKPKGAREAFRSLKDKLNLNQVVISVLAGITTTFMEDHLQEGQQVIRVMPNTSSMVQQSATALTSGQHTKPENIEAVKELLQCLGKVFVIEEEQMDLFTGIAGSGPAYFYYLMEHMESVGLQYGMPKELIREIVSQTVYGAAKMVMEKGTSPTILRENVTSPNGTTASGLKALADYKGGEAISQAIKHAASRSQQISVELGGAKLNS